MRHKIGPIVAVALMGASVSVQAQTAPSLQGAWRIAEVTTTGAAAGTNTSPQPGLFMFTKQHYSIMSVNGAAPRPMLDAPKDPGNPTDAEKLANYDVWLRFTANSGTYQVSGDTLTTRPLVAKNPGVMAGAPGTWTYKIQGNTMTLSQKSTQGRWVTLRLTRVE